MSADETLSEAFVEREHQAAYIFDPSDEVDEPTRPAKRRRSSKKHVDHAAQPDYESPSGSAFQPILDAESPDDVKLRRRLFEQAWSRINQRIQHVLREANQSTLENVTTFVHNSQAQRDEGKIPSAFIVTGANIASQDLLFEQLSEGLQNQARAKVVRLRSGDASNLKAALKKIIHDVTARTSQDEEDLDVTVGKDGRKYLNYDLEALYAHLRSSPSDHVVITFQDSEAFGSGLLSDLILLFSSWLDRIPFTLLFGVATSIELFQARLLKSTCQLLHGDQFDVEQSTTVVEKIFQAAIAHARAPLRLGSSFVQILLDRQRDQVAGIPVFVSSLKYAYMCHYYANPLSVLLSEEIRAEPLSEAFLDAVRSLPSFRSHVESTLGKQDARSARSLLDDDQYLTKQIHNQILAARLWTVTALRVTKILTSCHISGMTLISCYQEALSEGIDVRTRHHNILVAIQRLQPPEAITFLTQTLKVIEEGDQSVGLEGWADDWRKTVEDLQRSLELAKRLQDTAEENGVTLRSKYSESKVLRTTVIAQKVQLSEDTATLTDEDKAYTELIDKLVKCMEQRLQCVKAEDLWLHEAWLYDCRTPYKDVFVPRPRAVVERALLRPHDYLSCSCCKSKEDQVKSSFPATAILYHLYLETGSLINVADLWSAYHAIVGEDNEDGMDERRALVLFYRALSELRAMGFVKQTKKKADHVAKLAWPGL